MCIMLHEYVRMHIVGIAEMVDERQRRFPHDGTPRSRNDANYMQDGDYRLLLTQRRNNFEREREIHETR